MIREVLRDLWGLAKALGGVVLLAAYSWPMVVACSHLSRSGQHLLAWLAFAAWALLLFVVFSVVGRVSEQRREAQEDAEIARHLERDVTP